MATITITYSANLASMAHTWGVNPVSDDLAGFDIAAASISEASQFAVYLGQNGISGNLSGTRLSYSPGPGATLDFGGVGVAGSRGTASSMNVSEAGVMSGQIQGQFAMDFGSGYRVQSMSTTITSATVQSLLPGGADPMLGNVRATLSGALHTDSAGIMSGTITQFSGSADRVLKSLLLEGNFTVSGDNGTFSNYPTANVSGTLTTYRNVYYDGSVESIEGAAIHYDSRTSGSLLANAANFAGDDVFTISMPTTLLDTLTIEAGAGNDIVSLAGGSSNLHVNAGTGNDTITLVSGAHRVDGGSGTDTVVLAGLNTDYLKGSSGGWTTYTHRSSGAVESLSGIERIEFSNAATAYDINGNAGQAYRIYKAAFDRAPDTGGLGFWIDTLDRGQTLAQVASGFLSSDEYVGRYGAGISDKAFINNLYHNVLHRDADDGGAGYWAGRLSAGSSRAQVLVEFSESSENQAQVIGAIQNGIDYLPF